MPDFRMKEDIHKNIKYINNKLGDENWVPLQINSLIREGMLSDGVRGVRNPDRRKTHSTLFCHESISNIERKI